MKLERRRHSRYLPQENTFAAIGGEVTKVGIVKDISHKGMAIEYIAGENSISDPTQVDIFLPGNGYYLYNLPCTMKYEIEVCIPQVKHKYQKILTSKRCGLEYVTLDARDSEQLKLFIQTHTKVIA
jgi:hypothetical protein